MHNLLRGVAAILTKMGCRRTIHRPGSDGKPQLYLERFYLWKSPNREVMLHRFYMSDRGDLHNHPWDSGGVILAGGYWEYIPAYELLWGRTEEDVAFQRAHKFWRKPWHFGNRRASDYHKVELKPGTEGKVWTLFWTNKRVQSWGFHKVGEGFIPYREMFRRDGTDTISEDNTQFKGTLFPRKSQ